jgi:hypothetical protein
MCAGRSPESGRDAKCARTAPSRETAASTLKSLFLNTIQISKAGVKKTLDINYSVVVKYITVMLTFAFEVGAAKHRGRSEEAH